MTRARLGLAFVLLGACGGEPYVALDSGCVACRDSSLPDAGSFTDAYTARLSLTDPLGECLPEDEAECGCVDGFRRCDTCGWCPTGFACDEYGGVCRGEDYFDPTPGGEGSWQDGCNFVTLYELASPLNPASHYCATGKVCGASTDSDGSFSQAFAGLCFPVSFCQAATEADPPLSTLHCVYSDGSDVVNGPPIVGACPVGDPREPYCGGVCGDHQRCPLYPEFAGLAGLSGEASPGPPQSCVAFSETRSFGVCAWGDSRCTQGNGEGNQALLDWCSRGYGEPCACLVTHPQLDESRNVQGYVVLADVCRDYQLHFPGSTECVDANWNPLPPPGATTDAGSP